MIREIERQAEEKRLNLDLSARELLKQCSNLYQQKRNSKNKLYSFAEPDTVCISKGKIHKRYEFGNKSSFITTAKECFILHADAHEGNPYDGHTLCDALETTNQSLSSLIDKTINYLFGDKGYKGHKYEGETQVLIETSKNRKKHKQLKRHSSIEAVISHTKQYHRLGKNFLKGIEGNLANTIFAACGYNLKKIYNKFKKAFKRVLFLLFFMIRWQKVEMLKGQMVLFRV